jgi:pyruvate/2-oxoacid:ferredoxin oxidoreductase beta subunit
VKKNLGFIIMSHGKAYVASVALGTAKNLQFLIECFEEMESFNGRSLIVCCCSWIIHDRKGAVGAGQAAELKEHQFAVVGGTRSAHGGRQPARNFSTSFQRNQTRQNSISSSWK